MIAHSVRPAKTTRAVMNNGTCACEEQTHVFPLRTSDTEVGICMHCYNRTAYHATARLRDAMPHRFQRRTLPASALRIIALQPRFLRSACRALTRWLMDPLP
jgi:hypothetical protein